MSENERAALNIKEDAPSHPSLLADPGPDAFPAQSGPYHPMTSSER